MQFGNQGTKDYEQGRRGYSVLGCLERPSQPSTLSCVVEDGGTKPSCEKDRVAVKGQMSSCPMKYPLFLGKVSVVGWERHGISERLTLAKRKLKSIAITLEPHDLL